MKIRNGNGEPIPAVEFSSLASISQRLRGHVSALTISQVVYRGVSLLLSIALARYLGVVDQGVYGLVLSYVAVFGAFTDLGIANLVIREMNQRENDPIDLVNSYLTVLAIVNAGLFGIAVVVAAIAGYSPVVLIGIVCASFGTGFGGTSAAFYAVLAGREKMKRIAVIQLAITGLITVGMVLVMLLGGRVVALTVVAAFAGVATLVLHAVPARRLMAGIRLVFHRAGIRDLVRAGFPFSLHVGFYIIMTRIDVVLLGWLSDEYTLGLYTATTRLTYPLTILSMVTATAIFPVISRFAVSQPRLAHVIVWKAMRWLLGTGLVMAVIIMSFSREVVGMLFGPAFLPASSILQILIWYIPIFYTYQVVSDLLVASNRLWAVVWITAACLLLNVVLNILLIPRYGAHGAAMTSIFTEALRGAALILYTRVALRFLRQS